MKKEAIANNNKVHDKSLVHDSISIRKTSIKSDTKKSSVNASVSTRKTSIKSEKNKLSVKDALSTRRSFIDTEYEGLTEEEEKKKKGKKKKYNLYSDGAVSPSIQDKFKMNKIRH